jgi:GT2 family glycosyltransferase
MTPLYSIIIPHWNGRQHLETCLTALRQQSYPRLETILVDNGSTDGSQSYVKEHFPEVKLLELAENWGFTGACQAGYEVAQGEMIVLLNNDTEARPDWLAELDQAFQRHPQAGSVVGKILLFEQRQTFHTAGDIFYTDGRPGNRGVWQKDRGQFDQEEVVFSGCGAAVAYRRQALEQVGFLDNHFFFSCEDVDLGWRLNLAGWQVVYVPTAVVYHKLKASSSPISSYYDSRNQLYVLWKNYPTFLWRKHWPLIWRAQWHKTKEALFHWRGEAARATLRGQAAGLLGFFSLWSTRQKIQTGRQIDDKRLMELLTPVDESTYGK